MLYQINNGAVVFDDDVILHDINFEIKKAPSFGKIINVTDGAVNNTNATVRFDVINRTAVKIMIINLTGDVVLTFNEFSGNFISKHGIGIRDNDKTSQFTC